MLLAHKYATKQQSQYLLQCCGASRFVYNQLVDMFNNSDKTPSKKDFNNKVKDLRSKYSWLADLSTRIARNNVDDIANAIKKAFSKEMVAKRAKTKNYKLGFPKFHKRGVVHLRNIWYTIISGYMFKRHYKRLWRINH